MPACLSKGSSRCAGPSCERARPSGTGAVSGTVREMAGTAAAGSSIAGSPVEMAGTVAAAEMAGELSGSAAAGSAKLAGTALAGLSIKMAGTVGVTFKAGEIAPDGAGITVTAVTASGARSDCPCLARCLAFRRRFVRSIRATHPSAPSTASRSPASARNPNASGVPEPARMSCSLPTSRNRSDARGRSGQRPPSPPTLAPSNAAWWNSSTYADKQPSACAHKTRFGARAPAGNDSRCVNGAARRSSAAEPTAARARRSTASSSRLVSSRLMDGCSCRKAHASTEPRALPSATELG
mmetsp:Transcript_6134/g.16012  ORF Transcript_6134/g.16012 Transcript_6134/m.16012 type:complete len:296 (+) Transcript_6134:578-1465(+)